MTQQNKLDRYTQPKTATPEQPSRDKKAAATEGDLPKLTLKDVMEAISGVRSSLEQRMDAITSEVTLIRADLTKIGEKVKQMEITASCLLNDTSQMQQDIKELQAFRTFAEDKLDDYECRTRRNNVRIIGVPRGRRGRRPTCSSRTSYLNTYNLRACQNTLWSRGRTEFLEGVLNRVRFLVLSWRSC